MSTAVQSPQGATTSSTQASSASQGAHPVAIAGFWLAYISMVKSMETNDALQSAWDKQTEYVSKIVTTLTQKMSDDLQGIQKQLNDYINGGGDDQAQLAKFQTDLSVTQQKDQANLQGPQNLLQANATLIKDFGTVMQMLTGVCSAINQIVSSLNSALLAG